METTNESTAKNKKVSVSLDYRAVIVALLVVIVAMLGLWRPWQQAASDRTVTVTGKAVIKADPDEFVFYPSYEVRNADKSAGIAAIEKKQSEIVAKLKELGVEENKIEANSSTYDSVFYGTPESKDPVFNLSLTVKVGTLELAQKIQDYLITTSPNGTISPQAQFSDAKQKELEDIGRDEATKDARAKAEQSAKNLGFKVGKLKSIEDAGSLDGPVTYARDAMLTTAEGSTKPSLTIQAGENELNYNVTVVYFVR